MKNKINIVMLGAPGCGKGTQSQLLKAKYHLDHVSTGDLFRREIASKSELGLHAKEIIDRGDLCPDDLTLDMLNKHLATYHGANGFILDGVPRTLAQAKMLDGIGYKPAVPISLVIYLYVNDIEMTNRILKRAELLGRTDDTPETVKKRIANYYALTRPLESYYHEQNKLFQINGMNSVETVFKDLCTVIDKYLLSANK